MCTSKDIYTNSSMTVHLHKESNKIERTAGGYHIDQTVYDNTRKHVPTTDLHNGRTMMMIMMIITMMMIMMMMIMI